MLKLVRIPSMKERSYEPELMDNPACDTLKLVNTLKQFPLLNALFAQSQKLIATHILSDMHDIHKSYTFLDIGAGGCDTARWLAKVCRRKGINIQITCLDYDTTVVNYARSVTQKYPEITVVQGSAFELANYGTFDYVFTNHFLHHLTYEQIRMVIPQIQAACTRVFVLNDLLRSSWGYVGYALFTGLFIHRSFAHYDGLLSIRRGFLVDEFKKEVLEHIHKGNLLQVSTHLPARICITNHIRIS